MDNQNNNLHNEEVSDERLTANNENEEVSTSEAEDIEEKINSKEYWTEDTEKAVKEYKD